MKKKGGKSGSGSGSPPSSDCDSISRYYIPVLTKNKYYKIDLNDIEVIEQCNNILRVKDVFREEYEFKGTIEEIVPMLIGKSFFRAMKKVVINFDNVDSIAANVIHFRSGLAYGIGRNNLLKVRKGYRNYLYGYPPFLGRGVLSIDDVAEDDDTKDW
jgi:DNA-binding LytR/AlgR family response regulator